MMRIKRKKTMMTIKKRGKKERKINKEKKEKNSL